ncbi:hypothetical protein L1887_35364 [Cichorium endivia]|nr:hypothetical protein L1887_35364 [Cichorium endivia]
MYVVRSYFICITYVYIVMIMNTSGVALKLCYDSLVFVRTRVTWKQDCLVKTFLEACIHEVTTYGRLGSSLKATSWKAVGDRLKTEHNFIVDQKQIKNQYDYLRGKYAVWVKLKNRTGNIYEPITNTFNLTDEEWELEAKSNKNMEPPGGASEESSAH